MVAIRDEHLANEANGVQLALEVAVIQAMLLQGVLRGTFRWGALITAITMVFIVGRHFGPDYGLFALTQMAVVLPVLCLLRAWRWQLYLPHESSSGGELPLQWSLGQIFSCVTAAAWLFGIVRWLVSSENFALYASTVIGWGISQALYFVVILGCLCLRSHAVAFGSQALIVLAVITLAPADSPEQLRLLLIQLIMPPLWLGVLRWSGVRLRQESRPESPRSLVPKPGECHTYV